MNEKIVFLDRDGVINKDRKDYVKSIEEVKILEGVFDAIRKLNKKGFKVIVISNQSAINRGYTTKEKVEKIHEMILMKCEKNKCLISDFFYCPHTPDEKCLCRKPEIGLFQLASKKYNIDFKNSWMVGDKKRDVDAGNLVGCRTIQIKTNGSLLSAVNTIIENDAYPNL